MIASVKGHSLPDGSTYKGTHMLACRVVLKLLIYCQVTVSCKWLTNPWPENVKQHPGSECLANIFTNQILERKSVVGAWMPRARRLFYRNHYY